jgi:hypothetical protein
MCESYITYDIGICLNHFPSFDGNVEFGSGSGI